MSCRPAGLRESLERLATNKAPGVDGIRKVDNVKEASLRISDLSAPLTMMQESCSSEQYTSPSAKL